MLAKIEVWPRSLSPTAFRWWTSDDGRAGRRADLGDVRHDEAHVAARDFVRADRRRRQRVDDDEAQRRVVLFGDPLDFLDQLRRVAVRAPEVDRRLQEYERRIP